MVLQCNEPSEDKETDLPDKSNSSSPNILEPIDPKY